MQRCRELFAAAMRGVDDLVYDPEGDRLLLRGEEAEVEVECLDRARAGVFARLEEKHQEWGWIGWDLTNVCISDP